ncbi:glucuronide carrier protein [Salmonella enterica subsp. enterica serovar Heidelberg str. 77-2823]|nr:glucuronide carrier protein [Salmonella enterica subsp. enterica serovar Heidelberg str. 77-2823]
MYTGYTFSRKISAALAGFLPGIMLTQIGYIPNIAQSDTTLLGLRQLIFLWPCGLAIIAALTMGFFISSMNNVSLLLSRKLPNERKQVIKLSRLIINKVFLL